MFGISSGVILIKGYKKSFLGNLKNRDLFQIPNSENELDKIKDLLNLRFFEKKYASKSLFEFLSKNRMIYKIPKGIEKCFPVREIKYESKYKIEYLTLDYSNLDNLKKAIEICNTIQIPNLILKIDDDVIDKIENFIKDKSFPESVTIITNNKTILAQNNPFRIIIEKIDTRGFVNRDTMDFKQSLYIESQFHHNYFNKKMHINSNGDIKNTSESYEVFTNLKNNNFLEILKKAIDSDAFQKYWNITKDVCDVCKDCEFRYSCNLEIRKNGIIKQNVITILTSQNGKMKKDIKL